MNFPRYIFAIGGAGKNIIFEMLKKEWIIRELIKPRYGQNEVDIIIVDTATDEKNKDNEKLDLIRRKIQEITAEYISDPTNVGRIIGRINLTYKLLTEEMHLSNPSNLIGNDIGKQVKEATGAKVWWINDDQLGEDWSQKVMSYEKLGQNFEKGVYRTRAIGKAIYYKALAENIFSPNLQDAGKIDIIIGLGGGTGSGIAIDLAKKIHEAQPTADITLFGILATVEESDLEKANCYAILGELERACLYNDNPLHNIILVPMEVTKFGGKVETTKTEEIKMLEEFDETFPYILISYHSVPAEWIFQTDDHLPFKIATSQLIRYNVEKIKEFKEKLDQILNEKDKSLNEEDDVYNRVRQFIKYYTDIKGSLNVQDKNVIEDRFSKFDLVLNNESFNALEYASLKHIKSATEEVSSLSNDIEDKISNIKSNIETDVILTEEYKDDIDPLLYKILKKDIEVIEKLKDVICLANNVPDKDVTDTLKSVLKSDQITLQRKQNSIRKDINDLNIQRNNIETMIKSLQNTLNNYEDKIQTEIENKNREWGQQESINLENLNSLDIFNKKIKNEFANLRNELNNYVIRINNVKKSKRIDEIPTGDIINIARNISEELRNIEINYEDYSHILENLNDLKTMKKALIQINKTGFLDRLFKKSKKDQKDDIIRIKNTLNAKRIFDINEDNTFLCTYNYNIESKINQKKTEIIDKILNRLRSNYFNIPQNSNLFAELKLILEGERNTANIKEIIKIDIKYDDQKNKKESDIKIKIKEKDDVDKKIDIYNNLNDTVTEIMPILKRYYINLNNFNEYIKNIGKNITDMKYYIKNNEIRYIQETQPQNIFKATKLGANINTLLEDKSEKDMFDLVLKDGIGRLLDPNYNVISKEKIQSENYHQSWKKTKIMFSIISMANITPSLFKHKIEGTFSPSQYSDWFCNVGDTWGLGIVLFIAGMPFDNIKNVIDTQKGYYASYKNIENKGKNFFHHAYLLEEGKIVKRKNIFNLEKEEEKLLLLKEDEKEVISMFRDGYEELNIKDILK